jgi:hypothetical protein
MKEFFKYGEVVEGYSVRVLNEREARAGAGILFAFGLLSLTNAAMLGHIIVTKFFISFFTLDFIIRVINPNYSPSLLLGRFFVQNQTPEYVGASQKRFAWGLGLLLALPMFYMVVLSPVMNPIKVLICIFCLLLLISESAFSICFGCMLYNLFKKERATHCPAGVCEIKVKEPIQRFNLAQKIITILVFVSILVGVYAYFTKVENKTFLMTKVTQMMMSDEEKLALQKAEFQKELDAFDAEDDDF